MVMSEDAGDGAPGQGGQNQKVIQHPEGGGQPQARRVSEKEKELAAEASKAFNSGEYSQCLSALEKLEVLRPSDCTLAHNKIVSQCRAGGQVSLLEVVDQFEGLVKTMGLNLTGSKTDEEAEMSILIYNLSVTKFLLRHLEQASELASRLLPVCPDTQPIPFCIKVLVLNIELALALHQPAQATELLQIMEELVTTQEQQELSSLGGDCVSEENTDPGQHSARLLVLKARAQVLARDTRSLKKELKCVSLPGPLGQTTEFVRAHVEALQHNHRKAIKVLNSCVQAASSQEDQRNKVFPHFYNSLGCLHMMMRKPNLAVYYFKNALDRIESQGELGTNLTQSQVLYNIGLSLLHARRPKMAFDLLLDVVVNHYLDPSLWFHLAECCLMATQPSEQGAIQGVGSGLSHKVVAANSSPGSPGGAPGPGPSLSLEFGLAALKNAESLLPTQAQAEGQPLDSFCPIPGRIQSSNSLTWRELKQLRVAILAAQAYACLGLGDFLSAGVYSESLLSLVSPAGGGWSLLGHLYLAESLILSDRVGEAIKHLDPKLFSDPVFNLESGNANTSDQISSQPSCCFPSCVGQALESVEYNLCVALSIKGDFAKAAQLSDNLYKEGEAPIQVVLLVLYLCLQQGQGDKARRIVLERQCNSTARPPE